VADPAGVNASKHAHPCAGEKKWVKESLVREGGSLMAKERWISGGDFRPDPGVGTSLDEVAKGLASGTISRGKALRLMGSALVGAALISIPGVAWAKPKPGKCNKDKQCPTGQVCVGGQCEAVGGCTPGTICPNGTRCLPNATGGGGTCPCGGVCIESCEVCGPPSVCVQAGSSVCDPPLPFACVTPGDPTNGECPA
jgi:hypothetical protein